MRVLVVHNRYSSRVPSGENLAVDDEVRWLDRGRCRGAPARGDERRTRSIPAARSDTCDGVESGLWWSPLASTSKPSSTRPRPDVVHVHNLFPLLTASVPTAALAGASRSCGRCTTRRVRCVAGSWFRDGHACHECRPGGGSPASCTAATRSPTRPAHWSSPSALRSSAPRVGARRDRCRHQRRHARAGSSRPPASTPRSGGDQAQRRRRRHLAAASRRRAAGVRLPRPVVRVQGRPAAARRLAARRRRRRVAHRGRR